MISNLGTNSFQFDSDGNELKLPIIILPPLMLVSATIDRMFCQLNYYIIYIYYSVNI